MTLQMFTFKYRLINFSTESSYQRNIWVTMLISKGMMLTLLLSSLQWIRHKVVNANSTDSLNSITTSTSAPTGASKTTLPTSPRNVNSNAAINPVTKSNSESNSSIAATSQDVLLPQTTQWPNFTTKDEIYFSANVNTTLPPSEMTTTSSDLLATISVNSSETATVNFTTATANFTSMVSPREIQKTDTTTYINNNLTNDSPTTMTTKNTVVTRDTIAQTSPHLSFTGGSSEAREHQQENHNHGAVVFGAVVGAVLGSALIGLAGYFMCTKRKSESFGHQRLYDDTRNDPVLRLDNAPEPLDTSLGDLSYYNPATANERAAQNSKEAPHDTIPMDEMTSTPLAS
ncbi:mucin-15 isoform X1 [Pogona vitticeps]